MSEKRKRKSFWEPEQEHIRQWIANQKDLGRSIQLVAAEAIAKYGDGDVIEAMVDLQTGGTRAAAPTAVAPVQEMPVAQQAPAPQATPVTPQAPPVAPTPAPIVEQAPAAPPATPAPQAPPQATQSAETPPSHALGEDALANLFANQVR